MLTDSAAGVVTIVAVVLIVLALVYYLVSTIVALRRITAGLDAVIGSVVEIIEKSGPINESRACTRAPRRPASAASRRAPQSRHPGSPRCTRAAR
jgi:hypothetical protein